MKIFEADRYIPKEYKKRFQSFVSRHWNDLCKAAIEQYAKAGRSVLTFTFLPNSIDMVGMPMAKVSTFLENLILKDECINDEVRVTQSVLKHLREYNPDTEMVLWFSFPLCEHEFYCKALMAFPAQNASLN